VTARRRAARRLAARFVPRLRDWEHVPEGWTRKAGGWDVDAVVEAYRARLPELRAAVAGPGPLAIPTSVAVRDPEPGVREQGSILAFGYALALASRGTDRVSVLDWGGGLGYHWLLSRALLPEEVEVDYHCKELPSLCAEGRVTLPEVEFHDDDSCLERRYDLVLASSSLQYAEDWAHLLGRLATASRGYLLVNRVPVTAGGPSFVTLQRGHAQGLATEYLSWVLDPAELVETAQRSGLRLVRELLVGYRPPVHGAPEPVDTRGYLFRR
jgi:putative methyltransferase (TIGR04325 family)